MSGGKPISPYALQEDIENPKRFMAWYLAAIPPPPNSKIPFPIPIPVQLLEWASELAWKAGFRYHPDLATVWKIPLKQRLGIQDPGRWVERDEYEKFLESQDTPQLSEEFEEEALELLKDLKPELYQAIRNATPADRNKMLSSIDPDVIDKQIRFLQSLVKDRQKKE
ncbi:phage gene 29 protein family protein [Tsukamurella soli]|uniref:Bacteriocin-protection, YdeI or OmpD-Associated n=1 Tax=Tsukamurella soli TaxID=644556 RepID=A0ABP8K2F9_9ACTN